MSIICRIFVKQKRKNMESKEQEKEWDSDIIDCDGPLVKEYVPEYKVQVFVAHGFYEYTVDDMAQAIAHGQAIMATGVYRSGSHDNQVEFHKAYKVKVKGPGLASKYVDTFKRT